MTLTQPPDELEALIDLLVDTEREMTPDAPATALSHAAVVQPEQSSERTDSLQTLLSFNPALIDSAGVIRQSTPVPSMARDHADPAPVPTYANVSHSSWAHEPGAGDLMHPLSPPAAPYLPAAANMSNPAAKERGHLDDLPAPDTAIPADPDFLPVAPFLLSSGPDTGNNDDSESPFFVVGRTEGSTASLPHSRLRSLSRANAEYGTSSDLLASEGLWEEYSASPSKKKSIGHLTENLHRARAELDVVSRECERLKQLVQRAGFHAGSRTPASLSSAPDAEASRGLSNDAAVDSLIDQPSPSSIAEAVMDDVDGMSEAEAKQKLKDVLACLNLPVASLEGVPSSRAVVTPQSPVPSPPSTKTTPRPRATTIMLSSCPANFADVRRSLAFLERVDELVWKRSLFSQFGIEFSSGGAGGYAVPVDLRLRDGRRVHRRTSSAGTGISTIDGDGAQARGSVHKPNVFGEMNVKALEERLNLWERAVRSRPRR